MDEVRRSYQEALAARIEALEAASHALQQGQSEAIPTIRRMAQSLRNSPTVDGLGDVRRTAANVESSSDADLPTNVERLLAAIRRAASNDESRKTDILIIENDPETVGQLHSKLVTTNRNIFKASSAEEALQILSEQEINLILLDLVLPDMDGRSLLMSLREHPDTAAIPVIVLTPRSGSLTQTECFALGADKVFDKPLDLTALTAAASARLQQEFELERESRQDALTRIPNRAAFCEAFERARAFALRRKETLSIGLLDLDYFKVVNDSYGHAVGDEVLRRAAQVMTQCLRQSDLVARWGGEEFISLYPATTQEGAIIAMQKMLEAVRNERFQAADGRSFQTTFSGGVAQMNEEQTLHELVAVADRYLYASKAMGRNRVLSAKDPISSIKRRVLLAEDNETIAETIKERLHREGLEVSHYRDGSTALAAAQEGWAALILLDVQLPGMNGFEVLQHLRANSSLSHVPIAMLISLGSEREIIRGLQLGADEYITKPFLPADLVARVHRLLKKR